VRKLTEDTLAAIGRMTVAATDLEFVLAKLAGDAELFVRPGDGLRAARLAEVPSDTRKWIEAAATQLLQGQAALRVMWRDAGRTDAAMFDEITARLVYCRAALAGNSVAAQGLQA